MSYDGQPAAFTNSWELVRCIFPDLEIPEYQCHGDPWHIIMCTAKYDNRGMQSRGLCFICFYFLCFLIIYILSFLLGDCWMPAVVMECCKMVRRVFTGPGL